MLQHSHISLSTHGLGFQHTVVLPYPCTSRVWVEYFFNTWFSDGVDGPVANFPRESWTHFENNGPQDLKSVNVNPLIFKRI